jgi:hypothetical protein
MPKYVIERELPGAGAMSHEDLQQLSEKSVGILRDMGPRIQWVHSYVSDDKVYCVYHADSPDHIEEHARCGGFPTSRISRVQTVIDPSTAEA